jgi:hypothetical protein
MQTCDIKSCPNRVFVKKKCAKVKKSYRMGDVALQQKLDYNKQIINQLRRTQCSTLQTKLNNLSS